MGALTAAVSALFLVALLAGSWFAGYGVEKFLASPHCWPLARRAAYAAMVLALTRGLLGLIWRTFA